MGRGKGLAILAGGVAGVATLAWYLQRLDTAKAQGLKETWIPEEAIPLPAQQALSQWFPPDFLQRVDMTVAVPSREVVSCSRMINPWPERTVIAYSIMQTPADWIRIGANPGPWQIVVHPDYYGTQTASQLALLAHELVHVRQREMIPNFNQVFTQAALTTKARGLPPQMNPYEQEAYLEEAKIKTALETQGYPSGAF